MSGFLVVSNPKDREDKHEKHHRNHQNDEPEWFSCGPTSRLDTIELCGFDEDDEQQQQQSHSEKNSSAGSAVDGDANNDDSNENRIQNTNKVNVLIILFFLI